MLLQAYCDAILNIEKFRASLKNKIWERMYKMQTIYRFFVYVVSHFLSIKESKEIHEA